MLFHVSALDSLEQFHRYQNPVTVILGLPGLAKHPEKRITPIS